MSNEGRQAIAKIMQHLEVIHSLLGSLPEVTDPHRKQDVYDLIEKSYSATSLLLMGKRK